MREWMIRVLWRLEGSVIWVGHAQWQGSGGGHRLSLLPTTGQTEGDPGERQSWLAVILQLVSKGRRVSSSVFQQGHC